MDRQGFFNRVYPEPNTGCWLWVGRLNHDGYGCLHAQDNEFGAHSAHRYSYQLFKGDLRGLQVLHTCDMRCCVNPDHLFLGTQTENIKDMDNKRRRVSVRGEKIGKSVTNEKDAIEIKRLYATGDYKQIDIGKMFNVSRSLVACIIAGRTWAHIDGISEIKRHNKRRGGDPYNKVPSDHHSIIIEAIRSGFTATSISRYYKVAPQSIDMIKKRYS